VEGTPGDNSYADGALPAAPLEPNAESIEGYYSHPKFEPMPRAIYQAQVNFPADLTTPCFVYYVLPSGACGDLRTFNQ
jgi:hypothetical protein